MSLQSFIYCKDCQQSEEYSITVKTGNKLSDDFNEIYFIENSELRKKKQWILEEFKFNVDNKDDFIVGFKKI